MDASLPPPSIPLAPPPFSATVTRFSLLKPSSVKTDEPKTSSRRHHNRPSPTVPIPVHPSVPAATNATRTTPLESAAAAAAAPSLQAAIFNAAESFINNVIDPPLRPSVDPRHVLSGNYAPVDELPPTECEIAEGSLPPCLDGAYIRNGPNPQFLPNGPHHLFDGDGMLHCLRISGGAATLCSRYVRTNKYAAERAAAAPIVPNLFSGFSTVASSAARGALFAARVVTGQFNPLDGVGLANTSVARFAGRLFALAESDAPYEIRIKPDGDIETVGRHDFDGKLVANMTAHPKIDGETGEVFAFRVGPVPPFLNYFRVRPDGKKEPDVPIFSMLWPSFLHDFAITETYAVFTDTQLGMNPDLGSVGGGRSMVGADSRKVPRIGVIPRYAADESGMRWFEAPGFNPVHAVNAWDDGGGGESITVVAPNVLSVEHTMERMELVHASMEMVRVDLRTGRVWRRPLSAMNLDFAVINPAYVGKKNRYVYAAVGDPMPTVRGVVKLDLAAAPGECTVAMRMFGERCYGGEPFFVAREEGGEEDDGYVVAYVHDEGRGESSFLVMDARSPELGIVAAVRLPRRVPCGFHGLFVPAAHLNA